MRRTLTSSERKLLIRLLKQLLEEGGGEEGVEGMEAPQEEGVETTQQENVDRIINNTLQVLERNLDAVNVTEVFISDLNINLGDLELVREGDILLFQGSCQGTYRVMFRVEPRIGDALNKTVETVGLDAWELTWKQREAEIQNKVNETVQKVVNQIVEKVRSIKESDVDRIDIDGSNVNVSENVVTELINIGTGSIRGWISEVLGAVLGTPQ